MDGAVCIEGEHLAWMDHRRPTSPGREAARALAAIGQPAFDPLVRTLEQGGAAGRRHAAVALGLLDDGRVVPPLIARLADTDSSVREHVAWALGAIGDARATDALTAALKDEDVKVRRHAAWALGVVAR